MPETAVSTAIDVFDSGTQSELTISFGRCERMARWKLVIDQLLRFRSLGDDWDGQGAAAPDRDCLDVATRWAHEMSLNDDAVPPTQVVPGVCGEVSLIWQGNQTYVEAEISDTDEVEWTLSRTDGRTEHYASKGAGGFVVGE